jgi:DNA-binding beta-propeller fold protein YncE
MRTTFASGVAGGLSGLAFNNAGVLFAATLNSIYKFTANGTPALFSSAITPYALAFDTSGNLYATDDNHGNLFKFTSNASETEIASGLGNPTGVAVNSAGDVFVVENSGNKIDEFTPTGSTYTESTFASLGNPNGLAFQPVPEPSTLALLLIGSIAFFNRRYGKTV